MEPLTLAAVAQAMEGAVTQGSGALEVRRIHTDSRTLEPGDCFLALTGDRFDAHDFLSPVPATGAVAAVVSRAPSTLPELPAPFGLITVPDTLVALQKLSASYRRSHAARVIAVTGSSGKTSTKEMIASVLRRKFPSAVVATQGNLNNHIGVPLTLLQIARDTEYAVVEMGMNHRGEIAALAALAAPDVAVVTTAGSAHIENLGTRDAIADEKTDLLAALPADGVAVLNADDSLLAARAARAPGRVVRTGLGADCEWRAEEIAVTPQGISFQLLHGSEKALVHLPLFNRVMVSNALLAAAVGGLAGLSLAEIVAGLEAVRLVGKRMEVTPRLGGWLINDCYNANPESMRGALEALREFPAPARRIAVLGSMGELGEQAAALHRETGAAAARFAPGLLVVVGPHADDLAAGALDAGYPAEAVFRFAATAEAAAALPGLVLPDDTLLVKGSRFLKLEQAVAALTPAALEPVST